MSTILELKKDTTNVQKNLYLFMGLHKTGTTTLQALCKSSLSELAKAGFYYPITDINYGKENDPFPENHTRLVQYMFKATSGDFDLGRKITEANIKAVRDAVKRQLKNDTRHLVIIAEGISRFDERAFANLKKFFEDLGYNIMPFCILRPPGEWLNSMVAQWVAGARSKMVSIEKAVSWFENDGSLIKRRIGLITEALPQTKFITFEEITSTKGGLSTWFSEIIGVPELNEDMKANQRLSEHTVRFASMVNSVGQRNKIKRYFRYLIINNSEILKLPGNPFSLTKDEIAPVAKILADEELWFDKNFYRSMPNAKMQFETEAPKLTNQQKTWIEINLTNLERPFDELLEHYIQLNS